MKTENQKTENQVEQKLEDNKSESLDVQNLQKELEENKNLAQDRLNKLKYLQADFDNYRKKFDREKEDIIKLANENLIKELLVIIDDFERSLEQIKDQEAKKGFILVYKNLLKILENYGLKQINDLGKKFNPNHHEVLLKEPNEKDGIILEELQKGFMLKNKIIRTSKVKIGEKQNLEGGGK